MAKLGVGISKAWDVMAAEPGEQIHARRGCDIFVGVLSCAAMPYDEVERNLRLCAREVRPTPQALDGEARTGVPTAAEAAARPV